MSEQPCGDCGAPVPVIAGYVPWCHACGWNLKPPPPKPTAGRFGPAIDRIAARQGERLHERLLARPDAEPRLDAVRAASYALAAIVWLLPVAFLAAAAVIAVAAVRSNLFWLVGTALLVGTAILMRPRLGKPPDKDVVLRTDAPELHDVVAEVAHAVGTPSPNVLVVDHDFQASWAVLGWRRRRVLTLGLPLFSVLDPQQRVALLAHELAHARNRDAARGLVVQGSTWSLVELYLLLAPAGGAGEAFGLFGHLVNGVFWLLSRPVLGLLYVQFSLGMRDSQRAEYTADGIAARVAGAAAVVELHERLLLHPTFFAEVHHAMRDGSDGLLERALRRMTEVPERELERRRRVSRLESTRLESTHPSTGLRIALLEARPGAEPLVRLDPERSAAIDEELRSRRRVTEQTLVDEHRARLYY